MTDSQSAAIYGAFLAEGLHDWGYKAVLAAWDQGCLELMHEITSYIPFIEQIVETADKLFHATGFPGVFDYEVVSAFGLWFGGRVVTLGDAPSAEECKTKLILLSYDFFSRGIDDEGERKELMDCFEELR